MGVSASPPKMSMGIGGMAGPTPQREPWPTATDLPQGVSDPVEVTSMGRSDSTRGPETSTVSSGGRPRPRELLCPHGDTTRIGAEGDPDADLPRVRLECLAAVNARQRACSRQRVGRRARPCSSIGETAPPRVVLTANGRCRRRNPYLPTGLSRANRR